MFLANTFNTDNGVSDSFPIESGLYFRNDKKIKNDHVIFNKSIDSWSDQVYSLRAVIEGSGYDLNIDSIVEFFKKGYDNTFSVTKRSISYYEYLEDTREKRYEDYKTEYRAISSVTAFQFIIRGSDTTELKKLLNCLFMTMEGSDKYVNTKGEVDTMVYNISELVTEVGGRSKLIDLIIEGVKPFMRDLSEEDLKIMPWLGIEDIFTATEAQLPTEYAELQYYCW